MLLIAAVTGTFWQAAQPSALFARALLASDRLPELVKLNQHRLAANYATLKSLLRKLNIKYIPCRAGFGAFARIAPEAEDEAGEMAVLGKLRKAGVAVLPGKYASGGGIDGKWGWVKISIAVAESTLEEGLKRLEKGLKG